MAIYTSDHIGKWYLLDHSELGYVLTETFNCKIDREVSALKLIQGNPGTVVFSNNGKSFRSSLSSDVLIKQIAGKSYVNEFEPHVTVKKPPFSEIYSDTFDLLISDLQKIKDSMYDGSQKVLPKNALATATIQIGNTIKCNLEYNCKYDDIFNVTYVNQTPIEDFLARTAKNYDCKFYVSNDDNFETKILSGSIQINIQYTKFFMINYFTDTPIYSPQHYEISGNITIPFKDADEVLQKFNTYPILPVNLSILIGDRYLKIGQTSFQDGIDISFNENMNTADISFKVYAR
jgi:hypothetical protein